MKLVSQPSVGQRASQPTFRWIRISGAAKGGAEELLVLQGKVVGGEGGKVLVAAWKEVVEVWGK